MDKNVQQELNNKNYINIYNSARARVTQKKENVKPKNGFMNFNQREYSAEDYERLYNAKLGNNTG